MTSPGELPRVGGDGDPVNASRPRRRKLRTAGIVVFATALIATAVGLISSQTQALHARLTVTPRTTTYDGLVHIRLSGLHARQKVQITMRVRDDRGRMWSSAANYRTDETGSLDLDRAKPLGGSYYHVVDGMGLQWSLLPSDEKPGTFDIPLVATFIVSARVNRREVAQTSYVRRFSDGICGEDVTVREAGFDADHVWPCRSELALHPAVLVLGGSEAGRPSELRDVLLAEHGYEVLGLAYFDAPGLPRKLSRIPLEYFRNALSWLASQPGVDPKRVVVVGISRGAEAGLQVASYFPGLVSAVVAAAPTDVVRCSYDCKGPAWTLGGKPVPSAPNADQPFLRGTRIGAIPVERIRGPVLMLCGGEDQVIDGDCSLADAVLARLRTRHPLRHDELKEFLLAGHQGIGLIPFSVTLDDYSDTDFESDQQALEQEWPLFIDFLKRFA